MSIYKLIIPLILLYYCFEISAQTTTPLFRNCKDPLLSENQQRLTSNDSILAFINKHLVYPTSAINNNLEGLVLLALDIDNKGYTTSIKLLKSFDKDCANAALKLAHQFPKWIQAEKNGEAVRAELISQFALHFLV